MINSCSSYGISMLYNVTLNLNCKRRLPHKIHTSITQCVHILNRTRDRPLGTITCRATMHMTLWYVCKNFMHRRMRAGHHSRKHGEIYYSHNVNDNARIRYKYSPKTLYSHVCYCCWTYTYIFNPFDFSHVLLVMCQYRLIYY